MKIIGFDPSVKPSLQCTCHGCGAIIQYNIKGFM